MSTSTLEKESALQDRLLKTRRLVLDVAIGHNATPAAKTHATDLGSTAILRTQGKTAEADAVEDFSAQLAAATDSTGVFAVLVKTGKAKKIVKVEATPSTGTITVPKQLAGDKAIAIELDSNQNLSTTSLSVQLIIDYLVD
jgi:hypothetical protein